ncbi:DUF1854 domain-containing protein [Paenibacillus sp. GCM10023252]|uniref:DUF1854 domain-containing protein n=1 Tax=Paenibacillus sp. GCM10023252 TaxID=3252649 RepID=UPI003618A0AE
MGSQLTLSYDREGELVASRSDQSIAGIKLVRCYPFSYPSEYISVRDDQDDEWHFIPSLDELDEQSRGIAEAELNRYYLIPTIERISSIRRRNGGWEWTVETSFGPAAIMLDNLHENMTEVRSYCYILSDEQGRKYQIDEPHLKDDHTRKQWAKVGG